MQFLQDIGFNAFFLQQIQDFELESPRIARVLGVERDRIRILCAEGRKTIRLPHTTDTSFCVGDFCLLESLSSQDEELRLSKRFERKSHLERKSVGQASNRQSIAANIDYVCLVSSLNEEFNQSRLERYLLAIRESEAHPLVVLTKTDLCDEPQSYICLLYTSPSPRDRTRSRMPSSA